MKTGTIAVLIIIIAVLAIGGYMLFNTDKNTEPAPTNEEEIVAEPKEGKFLVILEEQSDSEQSGSATIEDVNGVARVTVNINASSEDGVEQPAHIHLGGCEDIGAVLYPLNNVVDGTSVTTLNVSTVDIIFQLPLSLNVHQSAEESDVYVACGELGDPIN